MNFELPPGNGLLIIAEFQNYLDINIFLNFYSLIFLKGFALGNCSCPGLFDFTFSHTNHNLTTWQQLSPSSNNLLFSVVSPPLSAVVMENTNAALTSPDIGVIFSLRCRNLFRKFVTKHVTYEVNNFNRAVEI